MLESQQNIKRAVRELKPYSLRADRARVKLNQNESPWDAPPAVINETLRRLGTTPWSRYPDFNPLTLQERLAEFSGWKAAGIIAGNGSNELIQALFMVAVGPGTRVLICEPTFTLYRQVATILEGDVVSVPLTAALTYDASAIQAAIETHSPRVTIICSPNNPTGCVIERADLISILERSEGLVVIDEAYHEFSGQSCVPLLGQFPNLVVLRTFSKAMAMAGLRVGYLLAAPELAIEIRKAVLPYNLNVISQIAASVAIEMYESEFASRVNAIKKERDRLFVALTGIDGLIPTPSQANFILVRSKIKPRAVLEGLLERDILVRDVSSYPMLSECFRVSVGTADENDQLLGALRELAVANVTLESKGLR